MTLTSKIFIALQHIIPQRGLTNLTGILASSENTLLKKFLISLFSKAFNITLDEYARKSFDDYTSFNDFFTRELEDGARPVVTGDDTIACPADGAISQLGDIKKDRVFQAKGLDYSLERLLASAEDAVTFENGTFATVYLAPSNYHRVHMPFAGTLTETRYVPGDLFSVNTTTAENVDELFARNERMVCMFDVDYAGQTHKMAVVLVGAMIVAGIETVATGKVRVPANVQIEKHNMKLEKGDELGRFYLGSTAVVVLPESLKAVMSDDLQAGTVVRMGQHMGSLNV